MVSPRLTNCKSCPNIIELISEIDCKVSEIGQDLYNNIVFILNKKIDREALSTLLHYKRILMFRICNPDYAGHISTNTIASKVKLLKYK